MMMEEGSKEKVDVSDEKSDHDSHVNQLNARFAALQFADDELDSPRGSEKSGRRKSQLSGRIAPPLEPVPEAVSRPLSPDESSSPKAEEVPGAPDTVAEGPQNEDAPIEVDESIFLDFLNDSTLPPPPDIPLYEYDGTVPDSLPEATEVNISEEKKMDFHEEEFDNIALAINRIPEEALETQKSTMEAEFLRERRRMVEVMKKKESDIIWREHQARLRIDKMEADAKKRIQYEKVKLAESFVKRERAMGREFRRVREDLEDKLKKQKAVIKETYGDLLVNSKAVSRSLEVNYSHVPLPIEMRVHLLRACKDKLQRGNYILMLSQFDRLGGSPLMWSEIGMYGISPDQPAITSTIPHQGRYYNRTLRVDDSVYALCPPRTLLKPSNVFILELFRLA
eukprot:CAMPEP_0182436446 /NCGR_PEP_ID=MMETSP1167-20130531/81651_1 /TAXON_ID=2988 /ORGANISM="Mallomonas Sp, Strain CCMP3275" /LENGTH=394 /DNA_ID=CAMNT_0024628635 /DNA_START=66 /DNA_END=1246 /DNA_ORIENTATION=-